MLCVFQTSLFDVFFRRKRADGLFDVESDTPQTQLVQRLTVERVEELKQLIQEEKNRYK